MSQVPQRGDAFDLDSASPSSSGGGYSGPSATPPARRPTGGLDIAGILQNPSKMVELLNVTPTQARNIKAGIVGTGAGLAYKYLGKTFGGKVAGAGGAFIAALLADALIKDPDQINKR